MKIVNEKVVDLFEYYNFDVDLVYICGHLICLSTYIK